MGTSRWLAAHVFRPAYGFRSELPTHLLRAAVDINTIRAWLGHVSVDTTNFYAEVDLEMKTKALAACDTGGKRIERRMWRTNPRDMEFLRSLAAMLLRLGEGRDESSRQ